jgi:mRNA interferase RelE/StbE
MKVDFKKTFLKELEKLKNKSLKNSIYNSIIQVELAESISEIKNIKKLAGFEMYYRLRVGDYRIGLKLENDTVNFVIFEHRKDIYKTFP